MSQVSVTVVCCLLLLFLNLQVGANVIVMVRRQSQYYNEEWEYCENIGREVFYTSWRQSGC